MLSAALLSSRIVLASHALASEDCPRGAAYLATVVEVPGACGVSFLANELLIAAPEAWGDARAATPQVRCVRDAVRLASDAAPRQNADDGFIRADGASAAGGDVALVSEPWASCAGAILGASCVVDVAVAPDGRVAAADAGGAVFVRAAGESSWSEVGRGILRRPSAVAWRGAELLVSDEGLAAVLVLGPDGFETARLGVGQLRAPAGLAAARDGTIVVADKLADCLWSFDAPVATGTRARQLGETGSNPGQFSSPRDVAVVSRGDQECLVVADELNHRVQVVGRDGAFIGFFGMHALLPRQGEGRIHYPTSVAVADDGQTLAVAEAFEDRVQILRLKPEADPVDPSAFGASFISSHFGAEIAAGDDLLALVDREIEAIAVCDARDPVPTHMCVIGGGGALPLRFGEISAMGIVPAGSPLGAGDLWVADRANARLDVFRLSWDRTKQAVFDQFLPKLARSIDLRAFAARCAPASESWQTPEIVDIAFDGAAAILLDRANGRGGSVLRTDARWSRVEVLPLPDEAREPAEIAVRDGRIVVVDPVARAVFDRGSDGAWRTIRRIGEVELARPSGVAIRADGTASGRLVVSDAARDALVVEEPDGSARLVGERGVLDEQFWDPQGIAESPRGLIAIDRGNHRYERFGDGLSWNLTGTLGRYYDRKRRGSPGAPPLDAPASTPETRNRTLDAAEPGRGPKEDS